MAREPAGGKPGTPKSDELLWLETYFIVFPQQRRPTLAQVERALGDAAPHLRLENLAADDDGLFASVLVLSPEDHAAVEVSYETGEAVVEQNLQWAKQLQKQLSPTRLEALVAADARLDVAHFERVEGGGASTVNPGKANPGKGTGRGIADEFESDFGDAYDDDFGADESDDLDGDAELEMFDPTCLLTVVETLSKLTRGLAFDPAAGEVV
ncbi:MAG TPA: hypothetical protein VEQ85_06745 [Lacipirellulaceae bacterium]|nr:hypothetical protein [Lacipirellulaceae bacterium]